MKAINILKQDDLFLIENTKTKKVFIANDIDGKERVCEHEHDKKDFIKRYRSLNGNEKLCKKCHSNDKKNSNIQVQFETLNPNQQNLIKSTADIFFPCFKTKDFLFFLEVRSILLQWVYDLNQNVFESDDPNDEAIFKPEISNMIKGFFIDIANLYNRDFGNKTTISGILSFYLFVKEEVTKEIKSVEDDVSIDFLSNDEIFAVLLRQRYAPFQYKKEKRLEYLQVVFGELNYLMKNEALTSYSDVLPKITINYRPSKFESYFRTTSILKVVSQYFLDKGIMFRTLITNLGPSFQMDKELFFMLKKVKSCSGFYLDARNAFIDYFKFQDKDNDQMAFFLSLDVPDHVKEFAAYKEQGKLPVLSNFLVQVIKIQYKLYIYNDYDKLLKTEIKNNQILLNVYDVFSKFALFDDNGILLGKYYSNTKNYSDIQIDMV